MIHLADVEKSFGPRTVLRQINLTIAEGESVVIVGPSGSGKSVLLKLICGFEPPTEGRVEIAGQDWSRLNQPETDALRHLFGMVFQDDALFDTCTVEENVTFPLEVRGGVTLSRAEITQKARDALRMVKLEQYARHRTVELSGGTRRRVGLARALAVSPRIILYDEPTTGLDPATARDVTTLIRQLNQQHPQITTVTITHDYLCAAAIADRIFYLNRATQSLQEITAEMLALKRQHGDGEAYLKAARDWIETRFEAVSPDSAVESRQPDVRPVSAILQAAGVVPQTIGQLTRLFFAMGKPLRFKDFRERVFEFGVNLLPIVCLASFFIGMIGMVQAYAGIRRSKMFLDPSTLPRIYAAGFLKVLAPLLVGILIAGWVGAHISAEIGTRRFRHQFEALRMFAISPERFLLAPIVLALVVTVPVMTLLAAWAGILGGWWMWGTFGESSQSYLANALTLAVFNLRDALYVVVKSMLIGVMIGTVGYQQGMLPKKDEKDIANATKNSILLASLLIVMMDFVANYLYTQYLM